MTVRADHTAFAALPLRVPVWSRVQPPSRIEEYELLHLLGRGAMGEVFVARDTVLDREVAIKFISRLDHAEARARFLVEARAIARLQHPHVVAIYRVGEVDGRPYLVSELVRGDTLERLVKPLPWPEVLRIALDLGRGLAAAHGRGVVHRDVKPSNAIRAEDGVTKLLDFGLAKVLRDHGDPAASPTATGSSPGSSDDLAATMPASYTPDTTEGTILGTPLYLAPECWRGEPATPRSDLYSLGALLYELLSGAPPHDAGTRIALGVRVMTRDAAPLEIPGMPRALGGIIERCLARDAAARFDTATELCAALEEVSPRVPAGSIPRGNPYRGLFAFQAEHAGVFFGRDAERVEVVERLRGEGIVLLAGDSGVGKSSLCRAGVLPAVAKGGLGDPLEWRIASLVPGRRPFVALCAAVAQATGAATEEVARWLDATSGMGGDVPRRGGLPAHPSGLLVFIDQLEELVTLADREEAERVADALGRLAGPTPGFRVLATVRSDFLTRLAGFAGIRRVLGRALVLLAPLHAGGVEAAITRPAELKGFRFESSDLVKALVASIRSSASLPLLQFTLDKLWDARDVARRVITSAALAALGGVEGALAQHADDVLRSLRSEQRSIARNVVTQLVSTDGTRVNRTASELGGESAKRAEVLEALVRGRLLAATDADGEPGFELAHEALVGGWGTLGEWLRDDQAARARCERLRAAAKEWERLDGAAAVLWSRPQLAEVADLDPAALEPRSRRFLLASRRAMRRRRLRGQAWVATGLAAIALTYAAVRHHGAEAVRVQVDGRLAEAAALLRRARADDVEVEASRRAAFEAFDGGRREDGERRWQESVERSREVDQTYVRATSLLEQARTLDPARAAPKELLADALVERVLLARRDHRDELLADLTARLETVDGDGQRRARLVRPAAVSISLSPADAQVTLERYEPDGPRLRPRTIPLPAEAEGWRSLPAGSYRLTATAVGHGEVHQPFVLEPGERERLAVTLPWSDQIPAGFVYVPAGSFLVGAAADEDVRRIFLTAPPLHGATLGAYLISRHETTFADWIEFLGALPPAERSRRLPRPGNWGLVALQRGATGRYHLSMTPATVSHEADQGEAIRYAGRPRRSVQDWTRFPVAGISADDALAYTRWLRATGRVPGARLCDEYEWERAGRGADARLYPHGDVLAPDDANFQATYGDQLAGPDQVGSHPASASPFGVEDLSGNVFELTRARGEATGIVVRGGGFGYDALVNQLVNRTPAGADFLGLFVGIRICAAAPTPAER